jgi:hypothetical protein
VWEKCERRSPVQAEERGGGTFELGQASSRFSDKPRHIAMDLTRPRSRCPSPRFCDAESGHDAQHTYSEIRTARGNGKYITGGYDHDEDVWLLIIAQSKVTWDSGIAARWRVRTGPRNNTTLSWGYRMLPTKESPWKNTKTP